MISSSTIASAIAVVLLAKTWAAPCWTTQPDTRVEDMLVEATASPTHPHSWATPHTYGLTGLSPGWCCRHTIHPYRLWWGTVQSGVATSTGGTYFLGAIDMLYGTSMTPRASIMAHRIRPLMIKSQWAEVYIMIAVIQRKMVYQSVHQIKQINVLQACIKAQEGMLVLSWHWLAPVLSTEWKGHSSSLNNRYRDSGWGRGREGAKLGGEGEGWGMSGRNEWAGTHNGSFCHHILNPFQVQSWGEQINKLPLAVNTPPEETPVVSWTSSGCSSCRFGARVLRTGL